MSSGRGLSFLSTIFVLVVVFIFAFIVDTKRCLYSFCFLIKNIYLLNMKISLLLSCCDFVEQNSQLDSLRESLKVLTSCHLVEVTVKKISN